MSIKNITILSLVLMASCFMPMVTYADAEFSDAEKEVIWFVDMCEQQASVGEHTEGMSKNNMDLFVRILPFVSGGLAIITLIILIRDNARDSAKKSAKK